MFLLSLQHNIIDYCLGLSRVRRLTLCSCRKSYRRHSHTSSQSSGSVFGQGLLKPFFQETQKWQLIWKLKVAVYFGAIAATIVAQCSHLGQVAVNIIDRLTCSVGNLVVTVSGYLK